VQSSLDWSDTGSVDGMVPQTSVKAGKAEFRRWRIMVGLIVAGAWDVSLKILEMCVGLKLSQEL
jgi:hypothetical protein